jgi:hypothetical protein
MYRRRAWEWIAANNRKGRENPGGDFYFTLSFTSSIAMFDVSCGGPAVEFIGPVPGGRTHAHSRNSRNT